MIANSVLLLDVCIVLDLVLLIHLVLGSFDHAPLVDELFHLLSAQSWVEDGVFAIAEGEYLRSRAFTLAIGVLFWFFGESVALARGFAMFAGILWILVVFIWVRHVAGRPAAYVTAFLFCLDPTAYFLFHFVRFYSLQGLLFFSGAAALYVLVTRWVALSSRQRLALVSAIGVTLGFSIHLQPLTLVGVAGLILWLVVELGELVARRLNLGHAPYLWAFRFLAVATVGLIVGLKTGIPQRVLSLYTNASLWNAGTQYDFLYYNDLFLEYYPVLWGLFPVALLFALVRQTRPALFCGCVFATVFILQSGGAMKAPRYIFPAVPFFFAVWGIALVEALPLVRRLADEATARVLPGTVQRLGRFPGVACMVIVLGFLFASTPSFRTTIKDIRDWPKFPSHPDQTWAEARVLLAPWLERANVLLTTNDVHAVYYFGGYDYQISKYRLSESRTGDEFGLDPRTGRWTLSTPESLDVVLSCYPTGLFVGDPFQWRHPVMGTSEPLADMIEARAERLPLPEHVDIRAYFWDHAVAPAGVDCAALPDITARR